jgi:predicted oxidoreductase
MPLPPPILGSMRFGTWGANLRPAQVADLLAAALDLGVDTVDLADIYGDHTTNALIGEALRLRPTLMARLRFIAKAGIVMPTSPGNARRVQHYDASPEHLSRVLDATLRDLGGDHIAQFLLHRPDALLDARAVADWATHEIRQGRIGGFGLSNADPHQLARFDRHANVVANQIELSLAHWAALEDGTVAASQALGAGVQAWSPLGHGALDDARFDALAGEFGLDRAGLRLRWVASVPGTRVIVGTTRADRLAAAARAVAEPLPRDAWYAAWQIAREKPVP